LRAADFIWSSGTIVVTAFAWIRVRYNKGFDVRQPISNPASIPTSEMLERKARHNHPFWISFVAQRVTSKKPERKRVEFLAVFPTGRRALLTPAEQPAGTNSIIRL
jgi:hypothetical protein